MVLSLVGLALLVLVVAGLSGQCSFSPTPGPDTSGAYVPTVDAEAELRGMANTTPFPLRVPQLPDSWRSNSADLVPVGDSAEAQVAAQVGWLPEQGGYLRLSQSSAPEGELVFFEVGEQTAAPATTQVGGTRWSVYTGPRDEPAWVADLGEVRILITGSASESDFRTLAAETLNAPLASASRR